jgi:diguanylate cyclase (GGDEF)-like protein
VAVSKEQLHLIVCETLAEEFRAVLAQENSDDVSFSTFPARCTPPQIDPEQLATAVTACPPGRVCCIVGPCGTAALGDLPAVLVGRFRWIEVCPDLLLGPQLTDYYRSLGDYLVLPGDLVHWAAAEGIGNSEPIRTARRLVLLDTGLDPKAPAQFAAVTANLGHPSVTLPVGLSHLRLFMARIILEWRLEQERNRSTAALSEAIRRSSDHAMALDLIGTLARVVTEPEAVDNMLDLFTLLFAPGRILYTVWREGEPAEHLFRPPDSASPAAVAEQLDRLQNDHAWTASGTGFLLRIGYAEETLGLIEIDDVAFPQHLAHYLDLALILGRVCALTISNARAYEKSKRDEETIRHQAYHDTLTGLPNRRMFQEQLTAALAQADREQSRLAVLFVDLDGFKQVNDQLGHDLGDLLLQEVARRLQKAVRIHDRDTVARLGGDEFLLLLPAIAQARDALHVAQRIRENLSRALACAGEEIRITASVGIALYPQDGEDAETLIKHADAALYHVKESGKDGSQLFGEMTSPGE